MTAQFLKEQAAAGNLSPKDLLWKNGLKNWVAAGSLPGLKFPQPSQVQQASSIAATMEPTSETTETPDENSIFDIMNDPNFASSPAVSQAPNTSLMNTTKPGKKQKKDQESDTYELSEAEEETINRGVNVFFCLVLMVVFLVLGICNYNHINKLLNEGVTVQGTVSEIEEVRGRRGRMSYYPIVTFLTEDGQTMRVKTSSSSASAYSAGQRINVVYLPSNPQKAEIEGSSAFSSIGLYFLLILAAIAFIGSLICGYMWWQKRQASL